MTCEGSSGDLPPGRESSPDDVLVVLVVEEAQRIGARAPSRAIKCRFQAQSPANKEKGCKFVIDTDSHMRGHLDNMRFGVGTARRAWLGPQDIVNCWPLDDVRAFFR